MDTLEFFQRQRDLSFENYIKLTHKDCDRGSLASVRTIFDSYVNEVKTRQQKNLIGTRLKTSYNNDELRRFVKEGSGSSSHSDIPIVFSNNTIEHLNVEQVKY